MICRIFHIGKLSFQFQNSVTPNKNRFSNCKKLYSTLANTSQTPHVSSLKTHVDNTIYRIDISRFHYGIKSFKLRGNAYSWVGYIRHIEFLARLLDNRLNGWIMNMAHSWKQMMLNLQTHERNGINFRTIKRDNTNKISENEAFL